MRFLRSVSFVLVLSFLTCLWYCQQSGQYQDTSNMEVVLLTEILFVLIISVLSLQFVLAYRKKEKTIPNNNDLNREIQVSFRQVDSPEESDIIISMKDDMILGRNVHITHLAFPDCQNISSQHCKLSYELGNMYLEDLGSKNGTYYKGRRIFEKEQINSGDVFYIGNLGLQISWIVTD